VSLFHATHPGVGGVTNANRPAADEDIGVTALQGSLERFKLLRTDRGLRQNLMPKQLWVHVSQMWLAHEILRSEFKPFTANNEINVLRQQGITPMETRYLTDPDSWLTTAAKAQHTLNFFWRRKPLFEDEYIKRPAIALFMLTARFIAGATNWRGIDGSLGQ
jgi:hypothetical protein